MSRRVAFRHHLANQLPCMRCGHPGVELQLLTEREHRHLRKQFDLPPSAFCYRAFCLECDWCAYMGGEVDHAEDYAGPFVGPGRPS